MVLLLGNATIFLQAQKGEEYAMLMAQYQTRMDKYLVKDSSVYQYFKISPVGISTFATPEDKATNQVEFHLFWDEIETFQKLVYGTPPETGLDWFGMKKTNRFPAWLKDTLPDLPTRFSGSSDPAKPLAGMRIAIDPGHIGGTMQMAFLERKYVKIKKGDYPNFPAEIQFNEGNLAVATSLELRRLLKEAGAEVMLTREKGGNTAFGKSYQNWRDYEYRRALNRYARDKKLTEKEAQWWLTQATEKDIFHKIFKDEDFKERARKINEFKPDLTLIVHYNIVESNEADKDLYLTLQEDNYCMAFVPGSFMKNETKAPEDRFQFLCKLLTDDIELSEKASAEVILQHELHLSVPAVQKEEGLKYLTNASIKTASKGVYARNLSMTRLVNSPMVFGESLCQDNVDECLRLFSIDQQVEGVQTSRRCLEVARAYFLGVLDYAKTLKKEQE